MNVQNTEKERRKSNGRDPREVAQDLQHLYTFSLFLQFHRFSRTKRFRGTELTLWGNFKLVRYAITRQKIPHYCEFLLIEQLDGSFRFVGGRGGRRGTGGGRKSKLVEQKGRNVFGVFRPELKERPESAETRLIPLRSRRLNINYIRTNEKSGG